ncbi:MAG: hypothetical protein ACK51L_02930 [bacterium]
MLSQIVPFNLILSPKYHNNRLDNAWKCVESMLKRSDPKDWCEISK